MLKGSLFPGVSLSYVQIGTGRIMQAVHFLFEARFGPATFLSPLVLVDNNSGVGLAGKS